MAGPRPERSPLLGERAETASSLLTKVAYVLRRRHVCPCLISKAALKVALRTVIPQPRAVIRAWLLNKAPIAALGWDGIYVRIVVASAQAEIRVNQLELKQQRHQCEVDCGSVRDDLLIIVVPIAFRRAGFAGGIVMSVRLYFTLAPADVRINFVGFVAIFRGGLLRAVGLLAFLIGCTASQAEISTSSCQQVNGTPMLQAELFFGRDISGHRHVSDARWSEFVRREITPRFPEGLTLLSALGQWRDATSGRITHERSFVVRIVVAATSDALSRLTQLRGAYMQRFHQQSVGLTLSTICASF